MNKKFFCTIGPASFNKKTLCRLEELEVSLFRINLSHTRVEDIEKSINFIRRYSSVPICLDTEGAQVRTGFLSTEKKFLKENIRLDIVESSQTNQFGNLSLYPGFIIKELIEGDIINIDFDEALIQIVSVQEDSVKARVISSGWVGNNKAVTIFRSITLPPFTEKDKEAVKIGEKMGIKHFALSFANQGEDVSQFRQMVPKGTKIISKIESRSGYRNLEDILSLSDMILIDRGDLSREIPIELIPFYQKKIIKKANQAKTPVYIATNLLESMTENLYPTRAEVNDVINALTQGADGLILAGETAIGKRPIETATMIVKLIKQFELSQKDDIADNPMHISSLLVEPHGGVLINRWDKQPDWDAVKKLPKLRVSNAVIMDIEQIGIGTYSPLEGFMTEEEINTVLDSYQLPNGIIWTLPIVLQKKLSEMTHIEKGKIVALVSEVDGDIYATLEVEDIYKFSFEEICQKWFGTLSLDHPGVQRLKESGDCFVGGKITLLKRRKSVSKIYELRPEELRHIFDNKGWSRVVGFHTRNVIHRGHEAIQKMALSQTHCDGLLISPVIGEKKRGDFSAEILLQGYQLMIDKEFFPQNRVFISAFSTYSRYSGAREAIFTALCRKNFGCSHFIVGRDHTGVGNFYAPNGAQKLFESLGDIGIKPVFFDEIKYCFKCEEYVSVCGHSASDKGFISGTQVRQHLVDGEHPPSWMMRKEVSELVIEYNKSGQEVFVA
ncbi:Sulfate adenylyltransferase [hydrothermal vent metagenome]|uniref:ATP-sulfurylase n=1 Tax=hydrothermal vent metagenome TaxID=652676 RepID=A0A3B0VZ20_9ZZZZ